MVRHLPSPVRTLTACQAPCAKINPSASHKSFFSSLLSLFSNFPQFADYFPGLAHTHPMIDAGHAQRSGASPGQPCDAPASRPAYWWRRRCSRTPSARQKNYERRATERAENVPASPLRSTASDFYTPRGYVLPLNSFVINKSSSKPSTNFVKFRLFYDSNWPQMTPAARVSEWWL